MTRSFIFPGQGSQFIGMGKDLFESFTEAREVFEEVDESLSQNLSKMTFEGNESDLNLTENTQPALMSISMAIIRVLEGQGGIHIHKNCQFVAGHSLGEYTALTAVGALSIFDSARLLKLRGQAMQKAVPVGVGAMAAIIGPTFEDVKSIADEAGCEVANDNSVGQVVISGAKEAIDTAVTLASDRGAKRAVLLPVSAPFHCSLMQPAADAMKQALAETQVNAPSVPVFTNVTAAPENDPETIKSLLVEQVTGVVRWRESVINMKAEGVGEMIETGAGKVLAGLIRRIDRDIECISVGTTEGVEELIKKLT